MRTQIYIDGYNLYYGCLKYTHFKWLDLYHLFEQHLIPRSGFSASSIHVKFFTAPIEEKAALDHSSVKDQRAYHQALTYHSPQSVQIINGYYSIEQANSHLVQGKKWPKDCEKVKTWKLEEKQSDVNLSVNALYDVMMNPDIEQVVFVTNDTDIAPAMEKIQEFNKVLEQNGSRTPVKIGLIIPVKDKSKYRRPNEALDKHSHWTIRFIQSSELVAAQLPWKVIGGRKPAYRPISWFRYPDKVQYIFDQLLTVQNGYSKCWQWLSEAKPNPPSLPPLNGCPIDLLDDEQQIDVVIQHVDAYVKYKQQ